MCMFVVGYRSYSSSGSLLLWNIMNVYPPNTCVVFGMNPPILNIIMCSFWSFGGMSIVSVDRRSFWKSNDSFSLSAEQFASFPGMFTESLRSFLGVSPKKNRQKQIDGALWIHRCPVVWGTARLFQSFMGRGMIWHRCHVSIMFPSPKNLAKMNRASDIPPKASNRYLLGILIFLAKDWIPRNLSRLETDSTTRVTWNVRQIGPKTNGLRSIHSNLAFPSWWQFHCCMTRGYTNCCELQY